MQGQIYKGMHEMKINRIGQLQIKNIYENSRLKFNHEKILRDAAFTVTVSIQMEPCS